MPKVQGTVNAVEKKSTQNGKTYYKVNVNNVWYSIWENPNLSPGDEIEFDAIQNGVYKNMANPRKVEGKPGVGSDGPKVVQTSKPYGSFDPDREARIVRQNATSSAVALVAASKLAGKADVETLLGTVREVSKKLFEMNMYGYEPAARQGPDFEAIMSEAKEAAASFFDA